MNLIDPTPERPHATNGGRRAHLIVCGNEKGGSGKSTIAVHVAVALLSRGLKVATVDLDVRQSSLTRYLENRRAHIAGHGCELPMPRHLGVAQSDRGDRAVADAEERAEFARALDSVAPLSDFVVIDTPGFDTNLSRAAHAMAHTLITPMNDSFVDYEVLARTDPGTGITTGRSRYALQVREARRRRNASGEPLLDWVLVRNRLSNIRSRNEQRVHESLRLLGLDLGFRLIDGVTERVVYRELFPHGLTVLDDPIAHLPDISSRGSHVAARADIERLIGNLDLPLDQGRDAREAARQRWLEKFRRPRRVPDIFAD